MGLLMLIVFLSLFFLIAWKHREIVKKATKLKQNENIHLNPNISDPQKWAGRNVPIPQSKILGIVLRYGMKVVFKPHDLTILAGVMETRYLFPPKSQDPSIAVF